jgi:Derlin-2/3
MAAIWGNGGQGGQFPLEQWFYEMPPVTRWWTVATVATSVLVQCHILTPFQLFYSFRAVYFKSQVLREKPQLESKANCNGSTGGFSQPSSTSVH